MSPNLSFLEQASVASPTRSDYRMRMMRFSEWCLMHCLGWSTWARLDAVMLRYFDECFWRGDAGGDGSKTLAALKFYIPGVSRLGNFHLPRCHRALKAWLRIDPGSQRLPLPMAVTLAICAWMIEMCYRWHALAVWVSFRAYLRPGENANLKVKNLVPPSLPTGPYSSWCLDLHPQADGRPGKTGNFNETVLLDCDQWMHPFLAQLQHRRQPDEFLWPFTGNDLIVVFKKACTALQLDPLRPCLYSLRHGGASEDLLRRTRTPEEVQRRGRWRSATSLKRYAKEAKLGAELAKISPHVIELGIFVEQNLAATFTRSVRPRLPLLP